MADKIRRNNPYKDWREFASVDHINRKMLHDRLSTDLVFRVREAKRDVKHFKGHSYVFYSKSQAFGRLLERMFVMRHHGETDVIEAEIEEKNLRKSPEPKNSIKNGPRNGSINGPSSDKIRYKQDENGPNIRGVAFDIKTGIVDIYDVRPDVFEEILR